MTNSITAINKAHQATINKAYKASRKYHSLVNLADTLEDDKAIARLENKQAAADDKFLELITELPAREVTAFQKQYKAIHGYEA